MCSVCCRVVCLLFTERTSMERMVRFQRGQKEGRRQEEDRLCVRELRITNRPKMTYDIFPPAINYYVQ